MSMDLDLIEIVTYVCAGLGVTLLFLCIILAMVILVVVCKKNFGRQSQVYSVVPATRDPLDLENAVLQRYHVNNEAAKGHSGLRYIDEVDDGVRPSRRSAPVKQKLFWKKKKNEKRASAISGNPLEPRTPSFVFVALDHFAGNCGVTFYPLNRKIVNKN